MMNAGFTKSIRFFQAFKREAQRQIAAEAEYIENILSVASVRNNNNK
jgi:hypothetical protein